MKKKSILSVVFLVVSLLSACGPKKPAYQEMATVKVLLPSSGNLSLGPIFIAYAEGYFTEYGIKVEYVNFNNSTQAIPLLVTGDLDVYGGPVNAGFLNTISMDNDIKVVADRGHFGPGECTYMAILIRKDLWDSGQVKGPANLKGLTFDGSRTGVAAYILSTYLAQAGLTLQDMRLKSLQADAALAALGNKAIDGTVPNEPDLTKFLNSGNVVVLAKAEDITGAHQVGILAFGKNLIVDHPDVGVRFLAAFLKGAKQYNEGKTERNLQILADATSVATDDLKAECWPAIRSDGKIDFASIDKYQKWLISQEQLDQPITESQFWDPGVLSAAQKLLNP